MKKELENQIWSLVSAGEEVVVVERSEMLDGEGGEEGIQEREHRWLGAA